jgi:subtilisin family serine protease
MVIASVDSGVDYNHPTLASQIAINEKEIPDNQIDDDKNGFVDDVIGYDLANSDNAPFDDDGHGTHTAALAAGRDFGMAKDAKILPVKVGTDGMSDVGTMASGVYYAVDRGAQIINMSNGATGPGTEPLEKAVNYAEKHGAIIVAAAGNGDFNSGLGIDDDRAGIVPASLPNDNIITVGASDPFNSLAPYSNYGAHTVDIVAPGGAEPGNLILSAATRNPKGDWLVGMAGTSMATPIVAGIVAQVWGLNPSLAPAEVKRIILNSGVVDERLKSVTVSGRQINALTAVTYARDHVSF